MINLSEFFKTHILGIIIIGIFCSLVAAYIYEQFSSNTEPTNGAEIIHSYTEKHSAPTPDMSVPALKIKFADGNTSFVSYSYQIAINPAIAPEIIVKYGDQKSALNDLSLAVEGAVYAVLETKSLLEVRNNRVELSRKILDLTKDAQDRTGHQIEAFHIREVK